MNIEKDNSSFNEELTTKVNGLWSENYCCEQIAKYKNNFNDEPITVLSDRIINEYANSVFVGELDDFLMEYFKSEYKVSWANFEVVNSADCFYNASTRWHLDGGIQKTLKLFVYLNSVASHGGNTFIIDKVRTSKLRIAGHLPLETEARKEDLTSVLNSMDLESGYLEYDLQAGDAVLFSPLLLAHKCSPPKIGAERYTFCFTLVPAEYFN